MWSSWKCINVKINQILERLVNGAEKKCDLREMRCCVSCNSSKEKFWKSILWRNKVCSKVSGWKGYEGSRGQDDMNLWGFIYAFNMLFIMEDGKTLGDFSSSSDAVYYHLAAGVCQFTRLRVLKFNSGYVAMLLFVARVKLQEIS